MGKGKVDKDFDELFKRVRRVELDGTQSNAVQVQLVDMMKDLKTTFENHDDNEMKTISSIRDTLTQMHSELQDMNNKSKNLEQSIDDIKLHIEKRVKSTKSKMSKQDKKLDKVIIEKDSYKNYFKGMIGMVIFIFLVIGWLINNQANIGQLASSNKAWSQKENKNKK